MVIMVLLRESHVSGQDAIDEPINDVGKMPKKGKMPKEMTLSEVNTWDINLNINGNKGNPP